ncbi:MAG: hypothetical protein J0H34_16730 [Rhizobiales bacterium]|nr:hypothetical protein [Hyphomicrobiales bacterium]
MTGLISMWHRTSALWFSALPVFKRGVPSVGMMETLQQAYALAYVEPFRASSRRMPGGPCRRAGQVSVTQMDDDESRPRRLSSGTAAWDDITPGKPDDYPQAAPSQFQSSFSVSS